MPAGSTPRLATAHYHLISQFSSRQPWVEMSKFPLPKNFFRCPQLNQKETDDFKAFAEAVSIDVVRNAKLEGGPVRYTLLEDDDNYKLYKGEDPSAPPNVVTLSSQTEVFATIDEVAELFRAESTEEYRDYARKFAKDVVDTAPLYTLAKPTEENPRHFIGVRWMTVSSPVPHLVKPRDFCFLECRYDFDLDGRRGWVRCFKSVQLPSCPNFEPSLGLVRATFHRVGFVFVETDRPGYLQATHYNQVDFGGAIPTWFIGMAMKRRVRSIADIDTFLREQRLGRTSFLSQQDLVNTATRSRCFLCQRKFGTFGTKYSCRKCGEVVCKSCSKSWNIQVGGTPQIMRVCTSCGIGHSHFSTASSILDDSGSIRSQSTKPMGKQFQTSDQSSTQSSPPARHPATHNNHLNLHLRAKQHYAAVPERSQTPPTHHSSPSFDFLNESILCDNSTIRDTLDDMMSDVDAPVQGTYPPPPYAQQYASRYTPTTASPYNARTYGDYESHDHRDPYHDYRGRHGGGAYAGGGYYQEPTPYVVPRRPSFSSTDRSTSSSSYHQQSQPGRRNDLIPLDLMAPIKPPTATQATDVPHMVLLSNTNDTNTRRVLSGHVASTPKHRSNGLRQY
ncbi:Aste57867_9792 [Aphanomyces stellatus]|uniref:Aste57867_9792 protein n=1 Tax=Aphanomyces stellatus TaxID=120398 RepID=A0A485KNT6_9STRA|nr:hypothetical protein As57867_009753 [Aphanomyces stellatus]VFT86671.1 Aste57867_9792 [Aphanomyces stellatus]